MKKLFTLALLAVMALGANAQDKKDDANKNKPVFTVVKSNPITSIKNQNRSGTCWDFSGLSYFESEILKNTGKTYDLCEMFVANKTYMDRAVMSVRMHGDVSEDGFTRDGLAIAYDKKKVQSLAGSDAARWLKLSSSQKKEKIDSLGVNAPEVVPTQKMRQEAYDNWETTDDHGMQIYGIAKDQNGREYYMVKNSWGEYGDHKGTWYMSKNFIAYKTMDFVVNKNAIPKDIRKKMGI